MAKRQKDWARRARIELMMLLGHQCAHCSCTDPEKLEFDCIEPQGHYHHKIDMSARMSFYRQQHRKGNIQLLCEKCHNKKTAKDEETIPW